MTKVQIKKLETILGKLEALQNEVKNTYEAFQLGEAKSKLMAILTLAERIAE